MYVFESVAYVYDLGRTSTIEFKIIKIMKLLPYDNAGQTSKAATKLLFKYNQMNAGNCSIQDGVAQNICTVAFS